uniref:Uncharacterized protein n=1 Tax=Arundo donax TaxID=35708 RepID=A0A0A9AW45_ARUDO
MRQSNIFMFVVCFCLVVLFCISTACWPCCSCSTTYRGIL